ncbi:MAG: hypothetical protein Q4E87_01620 [bacterium]|nr:hypothetical protein [bacterium]
MNTTKNVKVTMKNSKAQMLSFLEATYPTIAENNKDVAERVEFTLSNYEKAKKSEVFEVVEEVQEVLMTMPGDVPTEEEEPAPIENEVKKSPKKPKVKKSEPVENEVKKPAPAKKAKPAVKKSAEKTTDNTTEKDKGVKAVKQIGSLPVAKMFPEELTVDNLGVLRRADSSYKTMEDVAKALEEGKQFYFACYWSARHIKEFSYSAVNKVEAVKKFPNDLDILEPVYFCENLKRMWANSVYTEAMFFFENEDITHIEDTDPYNGEKFKVRVSSGMEFELYELAQD